MRKRKDFRAALSLAVSMLMLPLVVGAAVFVALDPARSVVQARSAIDQRVSQLSSELPGTGRLDDGIPQTTVIRGRDGTVLAEVQDQNYGKRISVPIDDVSPYMLSATVAAEDRRFFEHNGVDVMGLGRAVAQNIQSDEVSSGA